MSLFLPNDYKESYREYTPEYLTSLGKKALLCDIDNTLVTYDDPEPTKELLSWLEAMKAAGITVGFISNNSEERVSRFNASLGLYACPDAHKPLGGGMRRFMRETGLKKEEIAHLGDQVFTDVLMARSLGITALLVPPIKDVLTPFFRCKRALEKPIVAYYLKTKK